MKDEILNSHLRDWLEADPTPGLEKLVESEMASLAEHLGDFIMEVYLRGYDEGFDFCLETFKEGARELGINLLDTGENRRLKPAIFAAFFIFLSSSLNLLTSCKIG